MHAPPNGMTSYVSGPVTVAIFGCGYSAIYGSEPEEQDLDILYSLESCENLHSYVIMVTGFVCTYKL